MNYFGVDSIEPLYSVRTCLSMGIGYFSGGSSGLEGNDYLVRKVCG